MPTKDVLALEYAVKDIPELKGLKVGDYITAEGYIDRLSGGKARIYFTEFSQHAESGENESTEGMMQMGGELTDEQIETQNKNYFTERVRALGISGAIKEYQKHFGTGKKKYSIRKKR